MATAADISAMRRAVALAARGLGGTSPNPVVGCVITDDSGQTLGEGYHQRAGGPHAEVHALRAAGERARGATAYVTLEPCDHTGRTGPCSLALLDAGIARVVYAVPDPNGPAGGGGATLRAAGVRVDAGLLADEATAVNAAWLTSVRLGRPHVLWKYAATLDGRIAAEDGTSRWITSPQARADVHRLRAEADAVIVGAGTQRADDPHLAVRGIEGATQPLRVVLDTEGTAVREGARVLDSAAPTLIAVADDLPDYRPPGGAEVLRLPRAGAVDSPDQTAAPGTPDRADRTTSTTSPGAPGRVGHTATTAATAATTAPGPRAGLSVPALLAALYARDIRSVLLEGGPTLAGAFVAAGAVDKVVGYLAPAVLGAGPAALAGSGISTIADALRLDMTEAVRVGPDLRITAVPVTVPKER
ncbi:bifunctional diaminohydroxyphosphoribosylaminopyrimidine deaminase/5-amino-6-(5-phosphoribosylamino)uracil reductase RibD [Streptomyces sp. NPDC057638]|uniref:bifunctional diaminohydroxyphosphoribosylaminopyrimidine deaminase/5-amino-6-(5-phosphoribosylamino)uracil reductase RibD n=1 Tax=Streptomyces sp. NPDC057638 TaxID=3346190 RepID=UPI0036ADA6CD